MKFAVVCRFRRNQPRDPASTQAVAGPITAVLILAYFVSFAAIGSPDTGWARVISYFPVTAPLAMPNRMAMGATEWWEPWLAVGLTLAAIAWLVQLGGRVYTRAILRSGPTLKLRDVWRDTTTPTTSAGKAGGRRTNGAVLFAAARGMANVWAGPHDRHANRL